MKRLLICGSASTLWSDLDAVGRWDHDVMALNYAGLFLPIRVDHWVSVHHDFFGPALRMWDWHKRDIQPKRPQTHASEAGEGVDHVWDFRPHDYTGYFATKIALEIGYESIILAGVPMDGSGHFYDKLDNGKSPYHFPMNAVWNALPKDKIRSMSGQTKALFGYPSHESIGHPYLTAGVQHLARLKFA